MILRLEQDIINTPLSEYPRWIRNDMLRRIPPYITDGDLYDIPDLPAETVVSSSEWVSSSEEVLSSTTSSSSATINLYSIVTNHILSNGKLL